MTLAYVFIFIVCILLILIVLLQNSKGGGLAANFTGSQIMGVRKTADFLEKATWVLAGTLLFFCVVINIVMTRHTETVEKSMLQDEVKNAIDPNNTPSIPKSAPMPQQQEQNAEPAKK
jgi:preprotein translocase subunit SecG